MKVAVIGGSGIYNFDKIKIIEEIDIETPFGKTSDNILKAQIENTEFYFLPRHGRGHRISPSEINYRANIFALKKIGIEVIVSISAVGSLQEKCAPKDFVLPDQFIDWTKGLRKRSFFENGIVGHVSNAYPVDKELQEIIYKNCGKLKCKTHLNGTYICIEGPQFSTRAESEMYRGFGATVIGMTNVPEAFLAKEAGMAYATIAMVTDYDCWKDHACTLEEIMDVMKDNYISAQQLVSNLIPELVKSKLKIKKENMNAIVTNKNNIPSNYQEILEVILK